MCTVSQKSPERSFPPWPGSSAVGSGGLALGTDGVITKKKRIFYILFVKDPHAKAAPLRNEEGVSSQSIWYL